MMHFAAASVRMTLGARVNGAASHMETPISDKMTNATTASVVR